MQEVFDRELSNKILTGRVYFQKPHLVERQIASSGKVLTVDESIRRHGSRNRDSRKPFALGLFGKPLKGTMRRTDSDAKLFGDSRPGHALLTQGGNS
jgi:hypothetical protein